MGGQVNIAIIRHGESMDDVEDCYGGIADFELTERGCRQASALGKALASAKLQRLYSSPLQRAIATATLIAAEVPDKIQVIAIDELHERNSYGVLSGVTKDRAARLFHRELASLREKPGYSREPLLGAEDFDAFVLRVRRVFAQVVGEATRDGLTSIGIVTHGKFTQALFEFVFELGGAYQPDHGVATFVTYTAPLAKVIGKAAPEFPA